MIKDSDKDFIKVLDFLDIGLVFIDENKNITFWNDWIEERANLELEDAVGKTLFEAMEFESEQLSKAIDKSMELGMSSIISDRFASTLIPLHKPGKCVQIDSQKMMITTKKDINKKKFCIIQISDTSQALEREKFVVKQATELEEQRMNATQSGRLAALGEMAAGVAHEINNPLTIITLYMAKIKNTSQKKSSR